MHPLFAQLTPSFLVKIFTKPYLAGCSLELAIEKTRSIYREQGLLTTMDVLGEASISFENVSRYKKLYEELIYRIVKMDDFEPGIKRPTISLKPSAFTVIPPGKTIQTIGDAALAETYQHIKDICSKAQSNQVKVTIDMEDHNWTDFTLDTYISLLNEGLGNVGTVLQSMLHRTEKDIERLDERARIRIVIGIYREPASIALTSKKKMKERMLKSARRLLEKGIYTELGTHDRSYIYRFFKEIIAPNHISHSQFELQTLLGIPLDDLYRGIKSGSLFKNADFLRGMNGDSSNYLKDLSGKEVNIRLYVPFANRWEDALAYLRRRMSENPHIVLFVLKNMFTRLAR